MKALLDFWNGHGTKILGTVTAILSAVLLVPNLIPAGQMKWWQAASAVLGVLVVRRGFTNSGQQNEPTPTA